MNSRREAILSAEMGMDFVVQHNDRPATGTRFASFCIRGIPGQSGSFTSLRRRPKGRMLRGSFSGASSDRRLEVPSRVFDQFVSGGWRRLPVPRVDLASLQTMARLLKDADASSQTALKGSALAVRLKRINPSQRRAGTQPISTARARVSMWP